MQTGEIKTNMIGYHNGDAGEWTGIAVEKHGGLFYAYPLDTHEYLC